MKAPLTHRLLKSSQGGFPAPSSLGLGNSLASPAFFRIPNPSWALGVPRSCWRLLAVLLTHGPAPSMDRPLKKLPRLVIYAESACREACPEELDASQKSLRKKDLLTVGKSFLASDLSPCGHQNNACCWRQHDIRAPRDWPLGWVDTWLSH